MQGLNAALRRLPGPAMWLILCLPGLGFLWQLVAGGLGADPVRALEQQSGEWALRLLILSLAISPLMRLGLRAIRFRRAIGVMGFAYAALHLLVWLGLDMALRWDQILTDLWKRPYILVGAAAFGLLLPLALTSTDGWIRRLGPRWRVLHRLSYVAIPLGGLHFVMIGKVWTADSLLYLATILALLAVRLWPGRRFPA